MTTLRPFYVDDLFTSNRINLDPFTENFSVGTYMTYMLTHSEYFWTCEDGASGENVGYIMGKAEGDAADWHSHVSAVTVAPEYRRLGIAQKLMRQLEAIAISVHHTNFVDLFVRASNRPAIAMYERLGYSIHQRLESYYRSCHSDQEEDGQSGENDIIPPTPAEEDAFDMRKRL